MLPVLLTVALKQRELGLLAVYATNCDSKEDAFVMATSQVPDDEPGFVSVAARTFAVTTSSAVNTFEVVDSRSM